MKYRWRKIKIQNEKVQLVEYQRYYRFLNFGLESIDFQILDQQGHQVGYCDLRFGMNEELYYAGHIGYHIYPLYRGNHYALYATKLLLKLAAEFKMKQVYITCSPNNLPSKKTIEHLPFRFIEESEVPKWHWLWQRNEVVKDIYVYEIKR